MVGDAMTEESKLAVAELLSKNAELRQANEALAATNRELTSKVARLEEARDELSDFFASTRLAAIALDEALHLRRFTPAAATLMQLDEGDLGRHIVELAGGALSEELPRQAAEVLASRAPASRQLKLADGQWLVRDVLPYRRRGDRVGGVVVTFADVTGRGVSAHEHARRLLEESERRLQLARDAVKLGIYDYDLVTDRSRWDARTHELWGVPEGERLDYATFAAGVHPDDRKVMDEAYKRALDPDGDGRFWAEYRVIHREDGSMRWICANGIVLFEEGRAVRIVGAVEDVTAVKEAQRRLRLSQQELMEAAQRKDDYLAMLSHELRNPLSAIRIAGHMIKRDGGGDAKLRSATDVLERQTAHMTKLLDGLLDVTRITRGKLTIEKRHTRLAPLLRDVLTDRAAEAERKGVALSAEIAAEEELPLYADPDRLTQVMDNLVSNAIKFTGSGGRVVVAASRQGDEAVVTVRDTGVGFPAEFEGRLFEAFHQGPQDISRDAGGLGLGLALARGIVQLHGGTIEAHSDGVGEGAAFTVCLPLEDTREVEVTREEASAPPDTPLDVLLVEDNEDSAEVLSLLLESRGYRVRHATRGGEAVAMARAQPPDVVLCDIGLPGGVSGLDVARALRDDEATRGCALVALSGYGQEEDRERSLEVGFEVYLVKPVAPDDLLEVLRGVARR